MSALQLLKRSVLGLHRRLLPDRPEIGWTPYLWLVYLGFVYLPLVLGEAPAEQWTQTVAATLVFLVLYFYGYWTRGYRVLPSMIGICLIGMVLAPQNVGAAAFFIYAAAFACQMSSVKKGVVAMVCVLGAAVVETLLLDLHLAFLTPVLVFGTLVGSVNLYYGDQARRRAALRLSHDEVRRLAATAERERIARDLHDLLGHSLSLITIKTELARKLFDRDPEAARQEIEELEVISRAALAEVREAVSGYRAAELGSELANARLALDVAAVDFDNGCEDLNLPAEVDRVLAMCLREAITNVVRHAAASRCSVRLRTRSDRVEMVIRDDGRGGNIAEGSGLSGMRERLQGIGGSLLISNDAGVELRMRVPLMPPAASGDASLQPRVA